MKGYIYKTTYTPTGVMYFGSRKLKDGVTPEADSYRGSPQKGSNLMADLFATKPDDDFSKEILFVGDYEEVLELENLVIESAWDKWGRVSDGGLVTNLASWGCDFVVTAETAAKISAAATGKTASAETRAKLSAAKSGGNNPRFGKTASAETRAKISASKSNPSAETRAKLSAASKGRTASAETRAKISASKSNPSAETRAKMSAARMGRFAGADNPAARAVTNTATGQVWPTVSAAAKSEGVTRKSISARIARGQKGGVWKYL